MKRRQLALAACCAVLLLPGSIAAQAADEHERWSVTFDFGLNASSGNTQLALLSSGFQIRHLLTDEFRLEWGGLYRYGESDDVVVARNMRTTLTGDFMPQAVVSPFFFATIERDPFRRLRSRIDGGGGAQYTVHRDQDSEVSLSLAALYSRESFTAPADASPMPSVTDARWSLRLRGRRALTEGLRFEHTTFFQPVWDRLDDHYLDATNRLMIRLNDRFTIGLLHHYRFDATPPPDVLRTDQTVQATLTIEL